jgi:hypothetical protein
VAKDPKVFTFLLSAHDSFFFWLSLFSSPTNQLTDLQNKNRDCHGAVFLPLLHMYVDVLFGWVMFCQNFATSDSVRNQERGRTWKVQPNSK